ncbi:N/A [soil metagenome]
MDSSIKHMDNFCIHWGAWKRRYPSEFPLQTIGYIRRKRNWMRTTFTSVNFSFILSGRGEYWQAGKRWEVEAPCVLTQWPGAALEYGPPTGATWEELFLIFPPETFARFKKCGFLNPSQTCWKIADVAPWQETLKEITALGRKAHNFNADLLDRKCEELILLSLTHRDSEAPPSRALTIGKLQEEMSRDLAGRPDFEEYSRRLGASPATFRRLWMREVGVPPGRYADDLKIKEACRRLVETNLSVAEIAFALGYEDALYFSRRFRAKTGCAATTYRKTHRANLDWISAK